MPSLAGARDRAFDATVPESSIDVNPLVVHAAEVARWTP